MIYPNTESPLGHVPAVGGVAVDISTTDFTPTSGSFRRLYVGGAGNVEIKGLDGNTFVLNAVAAGTTLDVSGLSVMKASTTATLMVALL